ncbi:sugar phosphate isomerase/epimerase family protein [Kribbella catacumbae]|uniref:sugar phosphate isomerase/epimerase family protein n=1 Tax=Kribbella catacumbae TaxID=460086 RepID=UPI0003A22D00|nr:TIM barrel protein [Kribbella catacumbae]
MSEAGLVSVTLRAQSPDEVARLAADAGLTCIEWGADVHAPPSDLALVDRCRTVSAAYDLRITSYGSYWRAGVTSLDEGGTVLDTAVRLGAPRVRIWAGDVGSADASPETRATTRRAISDLAAQADSRDLELAVEFHPSTLTDTATTMLAMLDDVGAANVSAYWQPGPGQPDAAALDELGQLVERVSAVHVFAWWPRTERHPLRTREALWRPALDLVHTRRPEADVMIEFVPGDDVDLIATEAQTLRTWLG